MEKGFLGPFALNISHSNNFRIFYTNDIHIVRRFKKIYICTFFGCCSHDCVKLIMIRIANTCCWFGEYHYLDCHLDIIALENI